MSGWRICQTHWRSRTIQVLLVGRDMWTESRGPAWGRRMPKRHELSQHLHRADPTVHGFSLFNRTFSKSFRRYFQIRRRVSFQNPHCSYSYLIKGAHIRLLIGNVGIRPSKPCNWRAKQLYFMWQSCDKNDRCQRLNLEIISSTSIPCLTGETIAGTDSIFNILEGLLAFVLSQYNIEDKGIQGETLCRRRTPSEVPSDCEAAQPLLPHDQATRWV